MSIANAYASKVAEHEVSAFLAAYDSAEKGKEWYAIGDLAREFGVTLRALRFYEDKGLLDPQREGLNRLYSRKDRVRLRIILLCKRLGFSLSEIKEMLDVYIQKSHNIQHLQFVLNKFKTQVAVLEQQKADIEAGLTELKDNITQITESLKQRDFKSA